MFHIANFFFQTEITQKRAEGLVMGAAISEFWKVFLSRIELFGGLRHLIVGADF